ncbi:hypothetical protein D3C72_2545350 [compost metagenome]
MLEVLPFALQTYLQSGQIDEGSRELLVVHFPPDAQRPASCYSMPLSQAATV